jgi:arylsulfatase A-like enzyme
MLHRRLYPETRCVDGKTRRPVTDGFAVPPPRYADAFKDQPLPKGPSFNETNIRDKPRFMRTSGDFPRLTPDEVSVVTTMYRQRLASLLGIEDSVARIVQTLADTHQLDNTVIVYTSDHGFFLGQHRIPFGKYWPYEEALRVPLIIRGPGLPQGAVRSSPVVNVDLAPTLLSLAHARGLRTMDGRSLVPLMQDASLHWTRDVLLEGNTGNAIPYEGVRTSRYVYVEYRTGDRELYDLRLDPSELTNRYAWPAYALVRLDLQRRLGALRTCLGSSCARVTLSR